MGVREAKEPGFMAMSELVSTTTSLERLRGFTIELLFVLNEGGARCRDLAEITGKSRPYVHTYLKNLGKYGLAMKNSPFWFLTEDGVEFVRYLKSVNDRVYNNNNNNRKKEERKKKEERRKIKTLQPTKPKQIPISLFLQDSKLHDVEKEVVEVLVNHYNETGSKFILVKDQYELAGKLNKNPHEILPALKNLRQDNVIYIFRSREFDDCWKVGLKRAFVEMLKLKS